MQFSGKTYQILKWLVLIVIPAATTFYCVLDEVFGWGFSDPVTKISVAACTFIGAIIGISTATYYKNTEDNSEEEI